MPQSRDTPQFSKSYKDFFFFELTVLPGEAYLEAFPMGPFHQNLKKRKKKKRKKKMLRKVIKFHIGL